MRDVMLARAPEVIALVTIRSDYYEQLQLSRTFDGIHQHTFNLPPIPKGSYAELVKGPARRLEHAGRPLTIDDNLIERLLRDMDTDTAKDALPLLAVTLERLYIEHGGTGHLTLANYDMLGGIKGSIEAAIERAFKAADSDPAVPKDRAARLALLRRGLIPWLAGIDFESNAPRRRVARLSEVPLESRPLIGHLVEQRLLASDRSEGPTHQVTIATPFALSRAEVTFSNGMPGLAAFAMFPVAPCRISPCLSAARRCARSLFALCRRTRWKICRPRRLMLRPRGPTPRTSAREGVHDVRHRHLVD